MNKLLVVRPTNTYPVLDVIPVSAIEEREVNNTDEDIFNSLRSLCSSGCNGYIEEHTDELINFMNKNYYKGDCPTPRDVEYRDIKFSFEFYKIDLTVYMKIGTNFMVFCAVRINNRRIMYIRNYQLSLNYTAGAIASIFAQHMIYSHELFDIINEYEEKISTNSKSLIKIKERNEAFYINTMNKIIKRINNKIYHSLRKVFLYHFLKIENPYPQFVNFIKKHKHQLHGAEHVLYRLREDIIRDYLKIPYRSLMLFNVTGTPKVLFSIFVNLFPHRLDPKLRRLLKTVKKSKHIIINPICNHIYMNLVKAKWDRTELILNNHHTKEEYIFWNAMINHYQRTAVDLLANKIINKKTILALALRIKRQMRLAPNTGLDNTMHIFAQYLADTRHIYDTTVYGPFHGARRRIIELYDKLSNKRMGLISMFELAQQIHTYEVQQQKTKQAHIKDQFPTFPLPRELKELESIKLKTAGDLTYYGSKFQHCLGSYQESAIYGMNYFFRYEDAVAQVSVDSDGSIKIIQVHGPHNHDNKNVKILTNMLNKYVDVRVGIDEVIELVEIQEKNLKQITTTNDGEVKCDMAV